MEDYLSDLAPDLEETLAAAEDRLLELRWGPWVQRSIEFRGQSIDVNVNAANVDPDHLPTSAQQAAEDAIIKVLKQKGVIPNRRAKLGMGLAQLNHGLRDQEEEELIAVATTLATEVTGIAKAQRMKLRDALDAAERAIEHLRGYRISDSLREAETAERIEAELDPERPGWCLAHGGGEARTDAVGRTLLYIRDRVRDVARLVSDENVFAALERFRRNPELHERRELLDGFALPHARDELLNLIRCARLPDYVRIEAARALSCIESLDLDQVRRFINDLKTFKRKLPAPLITQIVRAVRRHKKETRHHRSAARALEDILLLNLPEQTKQEVFHALEEFAQIDTIERILTLPTLTDGERSAVMRLVERVMKRPILVRALRPSNFERLVCWMLQQERNDLDFEVVGRTRDGGIDIVGRCGRLSSDHASEILMYVQCKNRLRTLINEISEFHEQTKEHKGERWFVTRARCNGKLHSRAMDYGIKLIDRVELRNLLDSHASGRYEL